MLAMKVALMNVKTIPTIIFDEIDTGISGSTSDAVGKRMKALANKAQILAVTHQPQIASKADHHFKIAKIDDGKKVSTKIHELNPEEKVQEIARMLSGENISPQAIEVAKNLLAEGVV
jgi:DNA repair protein RecN (Recombination protein N)